MVRLITSKQPTTRHSEKISRPDLTVRLKIKQLIVAIVFVVKNDDGNNDHKSYNSFYFNYFLISYYRVRLFLAMQVRIMAACMESRSFIRSAQSRPRDGTCVSDVCASVSSIKLSCAFTDYRSYYCKVHKLQFYTNKHKKYEMLRVNLV